LHAGRVVRHHQRVEDTEATQLMLETLFVVRAKVSEIHSVVVGVEDEDEDGEEEEEDS
jgi:hypothetical protein